MSSWRDRILREFAPGVARLTLVADPDGLLLEESVYETIQQRGFEVIPFEDHISFRYVYESRFRSRWDNGDESSLIVALRSAEIEIDAALPYDLLQVGRRLSFNLGDLFPNLSYPVVASLDLGKLDALYEAQVKHAPGHLGDNATKEFILRHVFEIAPELIKEPAHLLRVLLRHHYRSQQIPFIFTEYLIGLLRRNSQFNDWPLEQILADRQAFFAFLQERWPVFLDWQTKKGGWVGESVARSDLAFRGPSLLPFDHPDVRVYLDNLFLEGLLHPVAHEHAEELAKTAAAYGVKVSPGESRRLRLRGLIDSTEKSLPLQGARYTDWFQFAHRWAELVALEMDPETHLSSDQRERLEVLRSRIDVSFTAWLLKHYASLINLPPSPPVMLHHVARHLTRILADDRHAKIALVIVDGLAMDQWIVMRDTLVELDSSLQFRESALFAWIPTLTSVSRQTVFAGKPPIFFPGSIHTTDKEPSLWTQFWADQGLSRNEVAYVKGLGNGELSGIAELLSRSKLRVVGLVVDKVDRIMHGMQLGTAGMHNQVRQWTRQGFMSDLLRLLHEYGFHAYLASDHGNVEAKGVGRPSEGAVAELRGERVRVFRDPRLRSIVRTRFPDSLEWRAIGLPDDYLAMIASKRTAFVRAGDTLVGHGGICLEELLVPLVRIDRKDR